MKYLITEANCDPNYVTEEGMILLVCWVDLMLWNISLLSTSIFLKVIYWGIYHFIMLQKGLVTWMSFKKLCL